MLIVPLPVQVPPKILENRSAGTADDEDQGTAEEGDYCGTAWNQMWSKVLGSYIDHSQGKVHLGMQAVR